MGERVVRRYSVCFRRQVVSELESGRFASIAAARDHYEIGGAATIQRWIRHFGRHHLQTKVVRVETVNEADRLRELKCQVADLERALGRTQAQHILSEEYLKLACASLGQDVEAFKKKSDGRRSTMPTGDRPSA